MASKPLFKVYAKDGCKYCEDAIDIINCYLDEARTSPDYLEVIHNPTNEVVTALKEQHDHHTYPFIFFEGEFIGGYSDMIQKENAICDRLAEIFGKYYDF